MGFIEVHDLNKVFGKNECKALSLAKQGKSRKEILEETGSIVALRNINFNVDKGIIFVVMGLSGSGKSTLVRCLNRLIEPTAGVVKIDGKEITSFNPEELREFRRNVVAMVFQHFGLLPHRNIQENVVLGLEIRGDLSLEEQNEKSKEAIKSVGLSGWEESYPQELSGGMQQRVGLARALATDCSVLLMDEPFSALDPLIRNQMQDELIRIQKTIKKTIIFITHDLDEALKLGDMIAILNQEGRIVQLNTPEKIIMNPKDEYVSKFVEKIDKKKVIRVESIMEEPVFFVSSKDDSGKVLKQIKENGYSFATDDEGKLIGVVTEDGIKKGKISRVQTAKSIESYKTVNKSIPHLLYSTIPLAVVDEGYRLKGQLNKKSVRDILEGVG